tara:strand:+ start:49 stop:297 length:249 start_codon:yes stop_codon:yes gene_type:complete
MSADFRSSICSGTSFRAANLTGAIFRGASLVSVDLSFADLGGVDMSDTLFENIKLEGARHDESTQWPENFEPPPSSGVTHHE